MSKRARKKGGGEKRAGEQALMRAGPNWLLFGLALIGVGLTGYLTASYWAGQALAGCTPGSACDVVLSSRWSKLLGLPTSFWGFLAYTSLAAIAWVKRADTHWKLAWGVSLFGVLFSLYLSVVSLTVLKAACPYCLTSVVLLLIILGTVAFQRPKELVKFSWRPWLLKTAAGGLIVVAALHFQFAGVGGEGKGPEDPSVRALAEHLNKAGAKFYGAYWCPHCEEQKELFGASVHRLPYVECSPGGGRAPQAGICNAAGVQVYPTWFINGQRYEGVLSLQELARMSGFKEPVP